MPPGAQPPPIRVLVVGPRGRGGVSRLFDVVRAELATRPLGDIQLRFVTTRGDVPGRFGALTTAPWVFTSALVQQAVLTVTRRVDVVHINLSSYGSTYRKLVFATCAAMFRVPYVIHLHGGNFRAFWFSCGPLLARRIDRMLESAARIVVLGPSGRDLVTERLPACAPAITVLPNAAPAGQPQRSDQNHFVRILFLGKLGPMKGVGELVEALGLLGFEPTWTATIAGDGAVAETRSMVDRLGLSARISVPGWLGEADVTRALEDADILVLPSHVESSPMAVIEAFAHALAVVTTPVGAIPYLVKDGRTGLLVPAGNAAGLADALRKLIADPALRRRLGTNARAFHAQHLEVGAYVRRLADVWRAAASQVERCR